MTKITSDGIIAHYIDVQNMKSKFPVTKGPPGSVLPTTFIQCEQNDSKKN